MIRSKDKQKKEEETASVYHLRKVNKQSVNSPRVAQDGRISYKHNMTTVTINDAVRIEQETVQITEALLNGRQDKHMQDTGEVFKPDYTHLEEFLCNLSQLSQASQDALVEALTEDEVKEVVKSCQNGKSPELDGLSYEFYKYAWNIIGSTVTKIFQAQLDREKLLESGRHGATCLVPKVEGVPNVTQLRPITFLQTDYRILSKCLAVRLHAVLGEVVDPGQLGTERVASKVDRSTHS